MVCSIFKTWSCVAEDENGEDEVAEVAEEDEEEEDEEDEDEEDEEELITLYAPAALPRML